MKSNDKLILYLRTLSPLFNDLVEEATRRGNTIITNEEFYRAYFVELNFVFDMEDLDIIPFGSANYPDLGLDRVIVVNQDSVARRVTEGNLGLCEESFAHEIGHNENCDKKSPCQFISKHLLRRCGFLEALADRDGLIILRRLRSRDRFYAIIYGSGNTNLDDFCHLPDDYVGYCESCSAIKAGGLDRCPKLQETKEITVFLNRFVRGGQ